MLGKDWLLVNILSLLPAVTLAPRLQRPYGEQRLITTKEKSKIFYDFLVVFKPPKISFERL